MFKEEQLSAFMGLGKGERIIALTPLGYPDTSFYGKVAHDSVEMGAMSFGRRKPLREIAFGSEWRMPLQTQDAELLEALDCVRLAPSWVNTQPWRFLVSQMEVIAVAEVKGRYNAVRDGKHYYRLDVGIAMAHFFLAAREMGWTGEWRITGFDPVEVAAARGIPGGYEVLGIYRR